jgi:8-oxo-dGTP pyrophosphatase MutT (NUDIX family)
MSARWDRLAGLAADEPHSGGTPVAAVLVPLYEDEEGVVRVVLTKRPETMPTHAGHLAFPGGRPDPADRSAADTALREANEEVGIDPERVTVLGYLEPIHTVEFSLLVVPVVGRLDGVPVLRPSEREVARVLEPPLELFADAAAWTSQIWQGRTIWFFEVDGEILWGATAFMMRRLLGLEG